MELHFQDTIGPQLTFFSQWKDWAGLAQLNAQKIYTLFLEYILIKYYNNIARYS